MDFGHLLLWFTILIAQGSAANPNLKYFGFAIANVPAEVPFTNVFVSADETALVQAHALGMISLIPSQSLFWESDPTTGVMTYLPNWQSNWNSYKPTFDDWFKRNLTAGFYVVDEVLWHGGSFQDLNNTCNFIRSQYPSAILFYVESISAVYLKKNSQGNATELVQVPPALNWFGSDCYPNFASFSDFK
eukprot:TRINITY_DN6245_c0_g1_i3.p1 TRINITY_DN6245_c0_g1~~TRINITY_DN6245_c0_g1_i3.p1  ORF type:complete len:189 (-),score=23.90 TRINITY_DN6245_c0_g1_i3:719-1285(-)